VVNSPPPHRGRIKNVKYSLALADGKWIGGFSVRRKELLAGELDALREVAASWGQDIIATRVDGPRHGATVVIHPRDPEAR
jgi:hypothetical protein